MNPVSRLPRLSTIPLKWPGIRIAIRQQGKTGGLEDCFPAAMVNSIRQMPGGRLVGCDVVEGSSRVWDCESTLLLWDWRPPEMRNVRRHVRLAVPKGM